QVRIGPGVDMQSWGGSGLRYSWNLSATDRARFAHRVRSRLRHLRGFQMITQQLLVCAVAAALSLAAVPPAGAQDRSLDEIKKEVMRRAGRINPFEGIRREDAERVMNALTSLDRDEWAKLWCEIGL